MKPQGPNSRNLQAELETLQLSDSQDESAPVTEIMTRSESPALAALPTANSEVQEDSHVERSNLHGLSALGKVPFWNLPIAKYDAFLLAFSAWSVAFVVASRYGFSDFIAWALLPSIHLQYRAKASINHWLRSALLGLPIVFLHPSSFLFSFAAGCITVTAYRVGQKTVPLNHLMPLLMVFFTICVGFMHQIVLYFTPHTIDATMLRFDHRWFSDISITTWHWAQSHLLVNAFFAFIYLSLSWIAVLILVSLDMPDLRRVIGVLLLAAVCAIPFYTFFPAVGPAHIAERGAPRNCMPSLHLIWAILLWRVAKPGWSKYAMVLFVLLTGIATLTTGEHYLLDLLVALPFAACWCLVVEQQRAAPITKPDANSHSLSFIVQPD